MYAVFWVGWHMHMAPRVISLTARHRSPHLLLVPQRSDTHSHTTIGCSYGKLLCQRATPIAISKTAYRNSIGCMHAGHRATADEAVVTHRAIHSAWN